MRLFGRLYTLRGDGEAERAAEPDDRFDDNGAFPGHFHRFEEGPVDLDLVEGEAAQIDQARIATAEIIEHHGDAQRAQIDHRTLGEVGIRNDDAFGEFELDALRLHLRLGQDFFDGRDEILLPKLDRGDVDRHANVGPALGILTGAPQDPFAQRYDEPSLLGQSDEFFRLEQALRLVPPAHQSFDA